LLQLDPIGVAFDLPEQQLAAVRAAGMSAAVRIAGEGAPREGKLSFIDSSVKSDSGTIALKASFANADGALWPGAYTRIAVQAGPERHVALLPPAAVLDGAKGRFVMVVGADSRITMQPVTLLRVEHQAALVRGLADGARVVTEGAQEARPGETVRVVRGTMP
jgi:RND family efflux transporter MFP subunit